MVVKLFAFRFPTYCTVFLVVFLKAFISFFITRSILETSTQRTVENRIMNFENALQKINTFVTIDKNHRLVYTRDFDNIRRKIFDEMKNVDPVFKIIACAPCLGGSFADNLKVAKPDEFDLVLQLEFPDQPLVEIKNVQHLPGFVTLNVANLMKKIEGEIQNKPLYMKLQQLIDKDGYLMQWKFQRWMQSVVDTVLTKFPNGRMHLDGKPYHITRRSTQGPAQTLDITVEYTVYVANVPTVDPVKFSVDFVPALRFPTSTWPAQRPCPEECKGKPWIALPKAFESKATGPNPNNFFWSTSFNDQERYFMEQTNFLKPSIRLLKKIRDQLELTNLKSYFINTVFLLIVAEEEKAGRKFGHEGLGVTFLHGFEKLLGYFDNKRLPFFWDDRFDMLCRLTMEQKSDICNKLKAVHNEILKYKDTKPKKLFEIFLTEEELLSFKTFLFLTAPTFNFD